MLISSLQQQLAASPALAIWIFTALQFGPKTAIRRKIDAEYIALAAHETWA